MATPRGAGQVALGVSGGLRARAVKTSGCFVPGHYEGGMKGKLVVE